MILSACKCRTFQRNHFSYLFEKGQETLQNLTPRPPIALPRNIFFSKKRIRGTKGIGTGYYWIQYLHVGIPDQGAANAMVWASAEREGRKAPPRTLGRREEAPVSRARDVATQ
jgi:hypothetical protein